MESQLEFMVPTVVGDASSYLSRNLELYRPRILSFPNPDVLWALRHMPRDALRSYNRDY